MPCGAGEDCGSRTKSMKDGKRRDDGRKEAQEGQSESGLPSKKGTSDGLPACHTCERGSEHGAESLELRAQSREPRAESREPRAESREPRAESREPRAESREPRAES